MELIRKMVTIPVIVDAGVGTASHVAVAMELGCDGVLLNTAIAKAKDPVKMATAMKAASIAGRLAFEAGRIPEKKFATPSTPGETLSLRGGPAGPTKQSLPCNNKIAAAPSGPRNDTLRRSHEN